MALEAPSPDSPVDLPLSGPPDIPSDILARPAPGKLVRHAVPLDETRIDPDVARVVRRLIRAGHEAYLVGGCVRDLLLGRSPKDFDVATSARPEEVRHLFRASRIIGRRFRLVHVLFPMGKIIEVATFRRDPESRNNNASGGGDDDDDEPSIIRYDNTFGSVEEDAIRRDFTINALFYDIEGREILDFVSGMRDIERRMVRTIGDPIVRFREDPVRMLRAIKFAGKLDLGLDPELQDALVAYREDLSLAAKPRLFEEILRLMRGGASRRSFFLAWEAGLLHVLLPEVATMLDDVGGDDSPSTRVFRLLAELDARTHERGEAFDDTILWTILLLEPVLEACDSAPDRIQAAVEFCEPIYARLTINRRLSEAMRRIIAILPRIYSGRLGKLSQSDVFREALAIAEISLAARGEYSAAQKLRELTGPHRRRPPAPTPA